MTQTIFDYIKITNGNDTIIARTNNVNVSGATQGCWVSKIKGLIEPGAANAEAKSRSFANGSVLSVRNNFAGKVINVSFILSKEYAKTNLATIERLITSSRCFISSDFNNKTYTAQFQSDGYTLDFDPKTQSFEVSMIFACEEAF